MPSKLVGFSKRKSTDEVWSVDILDDNMEPRMGSVYFSFDRKNIYNYWTDYKKLSAEQKWLFDDAFPYWAQFDVPEAEREKLKKDHPNWELPDDLEDDGVEYEKTDIEFVSE